MFKAQGGTFFFFGKWELGKGLLLLFPLSVSLSLSLSKAEYNNNNNKYISRVLNPSVSNQPEAQSAVHVQLKLSKLHFN